MLDFIRIACAVPPVRVADVKKNTADICRYISQADAQNTDVIVFPEMTMTGYTCQDLFFQDTLFDAVRGGLREILACSAAHPAMMIVVGLPVRVDMRMLNCAAIIRAGKLCGLTAKTYIPKQD